MTSIAPIFTSFKNGKDFAHLVQVMVNLAKIFLFSALLVFMGNTAHGSHQCVDIFLDVAKIRETDIIAELKEVENIPLDSPRWIDITPLGARNKTYKIEMENITVVFKKSNPEYNYSPRWAVEVLGSRIARLLSIEAPIVTQVRIEGVEGTAQVYIPGMRPLIDLKGRVFNESVSPIIKLLHRITLDADANNRNILVPEGMEFPKWRDQRPIDFEQAFNRDPSFQGQRFFEEGPRKFLADNIPAIAREFPEVHSAMLNPGVRRQIIEHMKQVRETEQVEINYVENFFQVYRAVNTARIAAENAPATPRSETNPKKPGLFDRFIERMTDWGLGN